MSSKILNFVAANEKQPDHAVDDAGSPVRTRLGPVAIKTGKTTGKFGFFTNDLSMACSLPDILPARLNRELFRFIRVIFLIF